MGQTQWALKLLLVDWVGGLPAAAAAAAAAVMTVYLLPTFLGCQARGLPAAEKQRSTAAARSAAVPGAAEKQGPMEVAAVKIAGALGAAVERGPAAVAAVKIAGALAAAVEAMEVVQQHLPP